VIVWILSPSEPLPGTSERELRSAKLGKFLIGKKIKVIWFTSTFNHQKKKFEIKKSQIKNKNFQVINLLSFGYKKNFSIMRLIDHILVGISFFIVGVFLKKPSVIISSFPPIETSFSALLLSKVKGAKHYLDYRDAWPETFYRSPQINKRLILSKLLIIYVKFTDFLLKFTNLITISSGFAKYLKKKTGQDIPYFNLSEKKKTRKRIKFVKLYSHIVNSDNINFVFLGNYSQQKFNFNTIVEASEKIYKLNSKIKFYFYGDIKNLDTKFRKKKYKNIYFLGWLDKASINKLISVSHVGIAPYNDLWDFNLSIPNKIAEYLSGDLPIISSLKGETAKFIKLNRCGLNYQDNSEDFFRCVKKLSKKKDYLMFKKNSLIAFKKLEDKNNIKKMAQYLLKVSFS
jgi:hypothetical protein